MNHGVVFFFTVFFSLTIASGIRAEEITDRFGRFGKITLYHPSERPAQVVLFFSGDGGWVPGKKDKIIFRHYSALWRKEKIALIGYSLRTDTILGEMK